MKEDIKRIHEEFHAHGVIPRGCNSFFALISKVDDPQGLGDFRPIYLMYV